MKKRKIKKDLLKDSKKCNVQYTKYSPACQGGCAYFLAFIGAVIYYIQTATSFWDGVFGVLKAIIWPVILAYKLFSFLA